MIFKAIILFSLFLIASSKLHRITVKGRMACNQNAVHGVLVKLMEKDSLDPDDELGTTHSDRQGYFEISGEQYEIGNIEPYLIVVHHCDNGVINPACKIEDRYQIPKEYVNGIYDMGFVSLNIAQDVHKKTCD